MPRDGYAGRCLTLYFTSTKECESWSLEAEKARISISKYFKEMAERGRAKGLPRPKGSPGDGQLRAVVLQLMEENKMLRKSKADSEAELLKLQYRGEVRGDEVMRQYSRELIAILQSGGLWAGQDLLEALRIPATDGEAAQVVYRQLKALEGYGLVQEDIGGWRWIG